MLFNRIDLMDKGNLLMALKAAANGRFIANKKEMRNTAKLFYDANRIQSHRSPRGNWKNLATCFEKTFFSS